MIGQTLLKIQDEKFNSSEAIESFFKQKNESVEKCPD